MEGANKIETQKQTGNPHTPVSFDKYENQMRSEQTCSVLTQLAGAVDWNEPYLSDYFHKTRSVWKTCRSGISLLIKGPFLRGAWVVTFAHCSQCSLLFTHLTICPTMSSEELKGRSWCELCPALCTSTCSRYRQAQTTQQVCKKEKSLRINYQPLLSIVLTNNILYSALIFSKNVSENRCVLLFYVAFCFIIKEGV